jgi:hypothetical protein
MEQYTYQGLGQGSNSIRLLRLLPGSSEKDIRCETLQYTLKPERGYGLYEALSYVWGKAITHQRILVNDTQNTQSIVWMLRQIYTQLYNKCEI